MSEPVITMRRDRLSSWIGHVSAVVIEDGSLYRMMVAALVPKRHTSESVRVGWLSGTTAATFLDSML